MNQVSQLQKIEDATTGVVNNPELTKQDILT
jgi:hypothetical protein